MLAVDLLDKIPYEFLSLRGGNYAQWRPLPNGHFDYFPKGMRKSGYRVDAETRDRLMRLQGGLNSFDYGVFSVIIVLQMIIGGLLSRHYPSSNLVRPLALFAGVVVLISIQAVSGRGARRIAAELLRQAPAVELSEEEYRETMIRRLEEAPKQRLFLNVAFLLLVVMLIVAAVMAKPEYLTSWMGVILAVVGLVVGVGFAQMAIDIVRVHRWRRAARRQIE